MAVAQPQILLLFNDESGTGVTNYGTEGDAAIGQGAENTNWAWHPEGGDLASYLAFLTGAGSNQAWIDLTGISLATTLTHLWAAMRFRLDSFDTRAASQGFLLGTSHSSDRRGMISFTADNPSGDGDFDLLVSCMDGTFSVEQQIVFSDLEFGVDYSIACFLDATTTTAHEFYALLDDGEVQSDAPANRTGGASWRDAGYLGRGGGFSNYYGFTGRLYYFAHARGTLITEQDLADINADPAATIGGWPFAGPVGSGTFASSLTTSFSGTGTAALTAAPGVESDTLKEPNESNANVANASNVTVRIWHGATITGAPDEVLSNQSITNGVLSFPVEAEVNDAISYQARWTVTVGEDTEDRFFEVVNATAINLNA